MEGGVVVIKLKLADGRAVTIGTGSDHHSDGVWLLSDTGLLRRLTPDDARRIAAELTHAAAIEDRRLAKKPGGWPVRGLALGTPEHGITIMQVIAMALWVASWDIVGRDRHIAARRDLSRCMRGR